jgi:tryptophanyl-tRNA synthetase
MHFIVAVTNIVAVTDLQIRFVIVIADLKAQICYCPMRRKIVRVKLSERTKLILATGI